MITDFESMRDLKPKTLSHNDTVTQLEAEAKEILNQEPSSNQNQIMGLLRDIQRTQIEQMIKHEQERDEFKD